MRAMRSQCQGADFCQELSGETDTEFHRTYGTDLENRIIGQSPNLCLLADMSPLCIGHLLLVSRDHYLSFAEVLKDHEPEVKDVLERVLHHYRNTFGRYVVLEHGSSADIDGSACITHAHWHVLPLDADAVHEIIFMDGLSCVELPGLRQLTSIAEQGRSYLYVGDSSRHRLYGVGKSMRRQYLRSIAGALLGIPDPEWDYALVVRKDVFHATMSRVASWSV